MVGVPGRTTFCYSIFLLSQFQSMNTALLLFFSTIYFQGYGCVCVCLVSMCEHVFEVVQLCHYLKHFVLYFVFMKSDIQII